GHGVGALSRRGNLIPVRSAGRRRRNCGGGGEKQGIWGKARMREGGEGDVRAVREKGGGGGEREGARGEDGRERGDRDGAGGAGGGGGGAGGGAVLDAGGAVGVGGVGDRGWLAPAGNAVCGPAAPGPSLPVVHPHAGAFPGDRVRAARHADARRHHRPAPAAP